MTAHVINDRGIYVGPAYSFSVRMDNRARSDSRDVGGCPADIDNSYSPFIVERDASANCGRQPFLHHIDPANMGVLGRCKKGTLLDVRYASKNTHYRTPAEVGDSTSGLSHKIVEHRTGPFKVRNDAIDHRSDNRNFASLAAEHSLRFSADSNYLTRDLIHRDHRWLINHYAATAYGDDRTRRSHIDCHRIRNEIA
jgi:hypothetical protein